MSTTTLHGARGAASHEVIWQPLVLRADAPECEETLRRLSSDGAVWRVDDTLELQLRDLARARACGSWLSEAELRRCISALMDGRGLAGYGNWVHYPWSGRLVRVLPESEFRELRLDRNRNKITTQEQSRLLDATVAIVGLSVGNAAALTLTLEGGYGHLRLADFDQLELSNLNRLRACVHDIGAPKAVLAARQIKEHDPYASLSLLPDGVTDENVERLFDEEPRVDVVVDECDSLDIKFRLREHARARRIPVVMETSDRGLIDVERFDLEPNRPLFHGRCGKVSADTVGKLGRPERIALVLEIVGTDSISARAAASLTEIDSTLSTWPQLASEVALGGATIAAAVRRLALGEPLPSGRAYLDIERALAAPADPSRRTRPSRPAREPVAARRPHEDAASAAGYPASVRFVVEHAILAPSAGNCQPWRFALEGDALALRLDKARSQSLLDTSSHASYLALGAAIENAAIAGAHLGFEMELEPCPAAEGRSLTVLLRFERGPGRQSELARLLPAVPLRTTNRRLGGQASPTAAEAAALTTAAAAYGSQLELLTERAALAEAAAVIGEGDRVRFLCPALHAEAFAEVRWSDEQAWETRDGIDVATMELASADRAALRLLARYDTAAALRSAGAGGAFTKMATRAIEGSGAVALLRVNGAGPVAWLRTGRAMQRVWLVATELGLAFQPMTALLYMLELLELPQLAVFSPDEQARLEALGTRLERLFAGGAGSPPALLFRLGKGAPSPTRRSLRRPLSAVLGAL